MPAAYCSSSGHPGVEAGGRAACGVMGGLGLGGAESVARRMPTVTRKTEDWRGEYQTRFWEQRALTHHLEPSVLLLAVQVADGHGHAESWRGQSEEFRCGS